MRATRSMRLARHSATQLRVVFRHLPVPSQHPRAVAARRSPPKAAGEQGMFWEMQPPPLRAPGPASTCPTCSSTHTRWTSTSRPSGRAVEGELHAERIERDVDTALRSGASGTPAFFVDGRLVKDGWGDGRPAPSRRGGTRACRWQPGGGPVSDTPGLADRIDRRIRRAVVVGDSDDGGAPLCLGRTVGRGTPSRTCSAPTRSSSGSRPRRTRSSGAPPRMLWFSGMAAGVSIGLTFLARMGLTAATGSEGVFPGDLLYPVGFVVVVLGRYQLFTREHPYARDAGHDPHRQHPRAAATLGHRAGRQPDRRGSVWRCCCPRPAC